MPYVTGETVHDADAHIMDALAGVAAELYEA